MSLCRWVSVADANLGVAPATAEVFTFQDPTTVDVLSVAGGGEVVWCTCVGVKPVG